MAALTPPQVEYEPGPWLCVGSPRRLGAVRARLPGRGGIRRKIAHLSDFHVRGRGALKVLPWLAGLLEDWRPDAVVVSGDFVDDKAGDPRELAIAAEVVRALAAVAPTVGINGNHDGPLAAARLESAGLVNIDGRRAAVAGIDFLGLPGAERDGWPAADDLDRDPAAPCVAVGHYPSEVRRLDRLSPDLYLTGHTHGGQICLPGGRPLMTHDPLPRRMAAGVHRVGGTWLFVSRGVGTTRVPLRLFCPPEVGLIELV